MVVVLRLRGLTHDAGSEDIRKFFNGLHIPDGGVLITGGKKGEAFIIFNTEREGLLAMRKSGKILKGVNVHLRVSSVAELKHNMESVLKNQRTSVEESKPVPQTAPSMEVGAAMLQCLVTIIQNMQTNDQVNNSQAPPTSANHVPALPLPCQTTQAQEQAPSDSSKGSTRERTLSNPGYVRLYGLPNTVCKADVCQFLSDVTVLEVIENVLIGYERCCLVKVTSVEDVEASLKYNNCQLNNSCITVRLACKNMWKNSIKQCKMEQASRSTEPKRYHHSSHKRHLKDPSSIDSLKRHRIEDQPSLDHTPKRYCAELRSPYEEYCVMVRNLPKPVSKTEIKELFSCASLPNNKIVHLLNKWREQTSVTFIIFTQPEDYTFALNMNGKYFGQRRIEVASITTEKMRDWIYKNRFVEYEIDLNEDEYQSTLSCIYARNFPADVRKGEVKDFFSKHHIVERDITLLRDTNGNGIGEAVVQFRSEPSAKVAHSLHMKCFQGQQIFLTCITTQQMQDILHKSQKNMD